ncbi:MAG: ferredoxin-thioredoxin reductase catalytic domain-containing protein [bacterium]
MANKWDPIVGTKAYNDNFTRITKIAQENGYILNPDQKRLQKVVGLMTINNDEFGKYYCPCKQSHPLDPEKDVLCPCPPLAGEVKKDGCCFCKLFYQKK